jgi:threonine dehydrogenase-like Zn-dependent dehydrogenase
VVGTGALGLLLVQLAARAGARVVAVSRRRFALDAARRAGAGHTLLLDDPGLVEAVSELTGGRGCARVIEAAGRQATLDVATRLTGERGWLVIAGYHQDGPRRVDMQLWNWRGLQVVNAHERERAVYVRGMREAIDAVLDGRLDPWPLFTHTYPLARLGEALAASAERPDGLLKALVAG